MSYPRRSIRPNHPCKKCGRTEFYEFSLKCTNCVRIQAGKSTGISIRQKLDGGWVGITDKTPRIDNEKEAAMMENVHYD